MISLMNTAYPADGSGDNKSSDDYAFTNELGRQINLADFRGQALAMDFIFTRCPIPQYCPRLSRNFAEATKKLSSIANFPTNWHFLSISIDPEFDTPQVLKTYAERYGYDPQHWSFLTGPKPRIEALGKLFGLTFEPDGTLLKHSFRTLVINRSNVVQQIIPVAGDFSEELVQQMIKAVGVTNLPSTTNATASAGSEKLGKEAVSKRREK